MCRPSQGGVWEATPILITALAALPNWSTVEAMTSTVHFGVPSLVVSCVVEPKAVFGEHDKKATPRKDAAWSTLKFVNIRGSSPGRWALSALYQVRSRLF